MLLRRTLNIKNIIACILVLIFITYLYFFNDEHSEPKFSQEIKSNSERFTDQKSNENKQEIKIKNLDQSDVIYFDLEKSLEPANLYDQIKCRKSAKFIAQITLCVHPLEKDIWVSQSIWNNGFWEGNILSNKS